MIQKTFSGALIIGMALLHPVNAADTITIDQAQQVSEKMEQAAQAKDIQAVMSLLDPVVEITMVISTAQGQQTTMHLNYHQYEQAMLSVWPLTENYTYQRSNEKINLSTDGKTAIVEADILEKGTLNGQVMITRTHEVATLELRSGAVLITKIYGDSKIR
jgi:ketosteroid isomerase-like protein